jgi:hypothetical protein
MSPDLVTRVHAASRAALEPLLDADWSVPARDLEWSCAQTLEHLADAYFAHAARITGRPSEWFVPATLSLDDRDDNRATLLVLDACSGLLHGAATVGDPAGTAYHPWGTCGPDGTIAMGCAEGLIHTYDAVAALGSPWTPPDDLAAPVLARIFAPDAPEGVAPGDALLWCAGRIALPGRPRRATWRWYGDQGPSARDQEAVRPMREGEEGP